MEIRISDTFTITGTPEEMYAIMILMTNAPESESVPEPTEPVPASIPEVKPAPAKKTVKKTVDWSKARALRNAGWSYEKIGDELNVSTQTVINHLRKEGSKE